MSDQLININDFKNNLEEKVKTEFANLIPENVMNDFITKTINEFEQEELPKLMMEVLKEHAKIEIQNMLSSISTGKWSSEENRFMIGPELEEFLVKAAPKMFAQVMGEVTMRTLSEMNYNN